MLNKVKSILHFHKWKYVRKYFLDSFEGIEYKNYYTPYRICKKCGKTQEFSCGILDCCWVALSEPRAELLRSIIVDEGSHYRLRVKEKKQ